MIDDIISNINVSIIDKLGIHNYRIEGDCELKETEDEKYPMVRKENKFERISMDDDYDYIMYHRVTNEGTEPDEDKSFGNKITYQNTLTSRLVISTKFDIGKDFTRDVKESFPHKITPVSSPNLTQGIFIETGDINWNHDENVVAEFGELDYGKIKDNWFVTIINYNIITFECR